MSDYQYYCSLINEGVNANEAARLTDLRIARRCAKRRLEKKNIQRRPTEREVSTILQAM